MHPPSAYHLIILRVPDAVELAELARQVMRQAFRTRLDEPGFSLLSFAVPIASEALRACMIELKLALADLLHRRTGQYLVYQSMGRFDQQATTKFHLDGGSPESFLMLGYEPSDVVSHLALADYTLAASKMGIAPSVFVRDHNPMYASGAKLLEGTTTPVTVFDPALSNILLINNSCMPINDNGQGQHLLGVMHQATIPNPDPTKCRIINSTMLSVAAAEDEEALTPRQQQEYVVTTHISQTLY